jgi:hypothetical protein
VETPSLLCSRARLVPGASLMRPRSRSRPTPGEANSVSPRSRVRAPGGFGCSGVPDAAVPEGVLGAGGTTMPRHLCRAGRLYACKKADVSRFLCRSCVRIELQAEHLRSHRALFALTIRPLKIQRAHPRIVFSRGQRRDPPAAPPHLSISRATRSGELVVQRAVCSPVSSKRMISCSCNVVLRKMPQVLVPGERLNSRSSVYKSCAPLNSVRLRLLNITCHAKASCFPA